MTYSTQDRFGFFGARWFCAVTTLVIIFEHFRRKIATQSELDEMRGRWMRLGNNRLLPPVFDSNYKDHEDVWRGTKPGSGWGRDPEAHGFIRDWKWAAAEIADVMKVKNLRRFPHQNYQILVVDVDGNPHDNKVSTHFIPLYKGKEIANPDPRLSGFPEVERRVFPI